MRKNLVPIIFLAAGIIIVGVFFYFGGLFRKSAPQVPANVNAPAAAGTEDIFIDHDTETTRMLLNVLKSNSANQKNPYLYPSAYDFGENSSINLIPKSYEIIVSIPFHNAKKLLRVYSDTTCPNGPNLRSPCEPEELKIVEYDETSGGSKAVGAIKRVSFTGNSSGIYVPYALTKDDQKIIYSSWMGSPGAGGSMVDYGFELTAFPPPLNKDGDITNFTRIATRDVKFLDDYTKAIYLGNSENTPQYSLPGPEYNRGAVIFVDLITGNAQTLISEPDTTYELSSLYEPRSLSETEAKKQFYVWAIHHVFSADCPRQEDSLYCSRKTIKLIEVALP